jgi:DNA-binding GntR family transcriptional regulator
MRSAGVGRARGRHGPLVLDGFSPRTAHEAVRESIRQAILRGDLEGGTRLIQSELAESLGVSTTPVREALRDLTTEGLVEFDRYRGAVVHSPTLEEVREIYEICLLLEPAATRKAVHRISEEDLRAASALLARMDEEDDIGRFVDLNRSFHALLLTPGVPARLEPILRVLRDAAAIHVSASLKAQPSQMRDSNAIHHHLLDAYRRRDAEAAAELTTRHLSSTVEAIEVIEPVLP